MTFYCCCCCFQSFVMIIFFLLLQQQCVSRHLCRYLFCLIITGFPFQRGRRHMPHIPSLGYSHCEVIRFEPYVFYPDKPIEVQVTVNHIDTTDKSFVHDASVSWVERVDYHQFTACVMAAGFNERISSANVTVDWMGYQGAPVGGVSGEVRISQWWTGTTCETVNFPSVSDFFVCFSFSSRYFFHTGSCCLQVFPQVAKNKNK